MSRNKRKRPWLVRDVDGRVVLVTDYTWRQTERGQLDVMVIRDSIDMQGDFDRLIGDGPQCPVIRPCPPHRYPDGMPDEVIAWRCAKCGEAVRG